MSLCQCDAERYLSPEIASPSHTQYSHTGRKFSENIRNKTFFQRKKNRKSRRLSFAAVPVTALTIHLYSRHQRQATSSVRNRLFSCYFLLEQHLYTSLLIENLDFQLCGAGHLLFFHVINLPSKGRVSTKGPLFCNCFQDAFL